MVLTPAEKQFDDRIKEASLNVKFDKQLTAMRKSHAEKLPHVFEDLDKITRYPDAIRWELEQQFKEEFSGQALTDAVEEELISQRDYYLWKTAKLNEIVELIDKEIEFRKDKKVTRTPIGTQYYIDSDNGNDTNTGLGIASGDAWATLHKFTETSRSAGDIVTLRRGMTNRYDDGGDLAFTSDGTIDNPIIIEADYGNAFGDDVDLSATATAILIFGSKTITFSADVSGVIAIGDWIYVTAEDAKEFAYEVAAVSTNIITLFLPYKGDQAGSGKTMTNMQSPPIWNTAAGNFQWNFDGDHRWKIQGLHIRGTDSNGQVEMDGSVKHIFKDCIFEGNGTVGIGIKATDGAFTGLVHKCRSFNNASGFGVLGGIGSVHLVLFKDCLFDGNSNGSGHVMGEWERILFEECEFKNHTLGDFRAGVALAANLNFRNCLLLSATQFDRHVDAERIHEFINEDFDGVLNDTRQLTGFSTAEGIPIIQSETSTVRSGGGTQSIKVTPSIELSTNWEMSRLKIFELPIYTTTDSKQYEIYFRPTATADWTADPTNTELWIELEAWGHSSNNFRKITKSTGVIDMNGSTSWVALSVTVAPAQAGVAYLKCYYAKTKESGKANTFFVDPVPVIT